MSVDDLIVDVNLARLGDDWYRPARCGAANARISVGLRIIAINISLVWWR